jgi:hypothetical protein
MALLYSKSWQMWRAELPCWEAQQVYAQYVPASGILQLGETVAVMVQDGVWCSTRRSLYAPMTIECWQALWTSLSQDDPDVLHRSHTPLGEAFAIMRIAKGVNDVFALFLSHSWRAFELGVEAHLHRLVVCELEHYAWEWDMEVEMSRLPYVKLTFESSSGVSVNFDVTLN